MFERVSGNALFLKNLSPSEKAWGIEVNLV
jgi:hypothetical protein